MKTFKEVLAETRQFKDPKKDDDANDERHEGVFSTDANRSARRTKRKGTDIEDVPLDGMENIRDDFFKLVKLADTYEKRASKGTKHFTKGSNDHQYIVALEFAYKRLNKEFKKVHKTISDFATDEQKLWDQFGSTK